MRGGGIEFDFVDFRGVKSIVKDGIRYYEEVDSKSTIVDLGQESEFFSLSPEQYNSMRITNYDPSILKQHHNSGKNEYCISNYLLEADVVINMPKPKTHRKAGVTISLKNIVGVNSRKEFLPHHTNGSVDEGGDEYLSRSILKRIRAHFLDKRNYYSQTEKNYKGVRLYNRLLSGIALLQRFSKADSYSEGSWYGNKTISKTIIDLNKILFYADKNGKMMEIPQRKYFIVADMIVSGEKEGPVEPSPKNVGIIAVGDNPVHFDEVIGTLMGINGDIFETLKCVKNSRGKYNLLFGEEHIIKSNSNQYNEKCISEICLDDYLYFAPAKGWIEAFTVKE